MCPAKKWPFEDEYIWLARHPQRGGKLSVRSHFATPRASGATAAASLFLDMLPERMPFPVRALQVQAGTDFAVDFGQAVKLISSALARVATSRAQS